MKYDGVVLLSFQFPIFGRALCHVHWSQPTYSNNAIPILLFRLNVLAPKVKQEPPQTMFL